MLRMSLPADYHLHTPFCRHAVGEPTEYAARALELGFAEIGFSDHAPMPQDEFDDWRMTAGELDTYVAGVRQAKCAHPGLDIKLGLEIDFFPNHVGWVLDLAARHPWDYLIGSVHYVSDSWALDDPRQLSEWYRQDPWEVWEAYFERLTLAAESGLFDIIGHADLCKKFRICPSRDCTPLFERFLSEARKHDTAVELNTAGLRKDCREIYPGAHFLSLAAKAGVAITFGSDAHSPHEVGLGFAEAIQLARSVGYTQYRRFTQRRSETAKF
jgi:histidinol-phosphatase (PHP family)